jgi:hypothetical protein
MNVISTVKKNWIFFSCLFRKFLSFFFFKLSKHFKYLT